MTDKVYFIQSRGQIRTTGYLPEISRVLKPGTYSVGLDPAGYYLEPIDDLKAEGKLYGDLNTKADRIINTFMTRSNSTGVLLEGEKGSGKTLLARRISEKLKEQGVSTLVVGQPFHGDSFNRLIQSIEQPTMLLFDEFEKVYDSQTQQQLLTLFDGLFTTKKMFLVTVNESFKIIEQMKNRPGRFFYRLSYTGLDPSFVEEYTADNLKNKAHSKSVNVFASSFTAFNFDILKALIEEMNRYNENAAEASRFLNAVPFDTRGQFKIEECELTQPKVKQFKLASEFISQRMNVNPFRESVYISYASSNTIDKAKKTASDDDELDLLDEIDGKVYHIRFQPEHIVKLEGNKFFYESPEGSLTISKHIEKLPSYERFLAE